jgi:hypothetical protein
MSTESGQVCVVPSNPCPAAMSDRLTAEAEELTRLIQKIDVCFSGGCSVEKNL